MHEHKYTGRSDISIDTVRKYGNTWATDSSFGTVHELILFLKYHKVVKYTVCD